MRLIKLKLINRNLFMPLIAAVAWFSGCSAQDKDGNMSVAELKNAMKNDSSLVILDVRNPDELTGPLGHIDGVINIPVQDLEKRAGELEPYKDKNIAVICRTGRRSDAAQEMLNKKGFRAKSVSGGMTEYKKQE